MNWENLTERQYAILHKPVRYFANYLGRLRKRMAERGFPQDDFIFGKVVAAHETAKSLEQELHKRAHGRTYGGTSRKE